MPVYTTAEAVAEYLEDSDQTLPAEAAAAARLIDRAERQVDSLLVGRRGGGPAGLKVDPAELDVSGETWKADSLARAVGAQVKYRLTMGEDFFARDQHKSVSSPDGGAEGKLRRIGPEVQEELAGTGLLLTGTTLREAAGARPFPRLPRE